MRTEAFGIGGLGGHFTLKGIKTIEEIIDHIGPEIDMHSRLHGTWEKIADDIIARAKKYGKPDLVVLVGHSWGCKRIPEIARRLASYDINVDYAAGIDPTRLLKGEMSIPKNVLDVDEFWATSGVVERGRKSGAPGCMFVFDEGWDGTYTRTIVQGGHIQCAKSPITQNRIKQKVEALLEALA
jgi:hypothetical protein